MGGRSSADGCRRNGRMNGRAVPITGQIGSLPVYLDRAPLRVASCLQILGKRLARKLRQQLIPPSHAVIATTPPRR